MNSFTIPCELCTLNDYISAERTNKHIAASIKKKQTKLITLYCKQLKINKTKQYDLEINWFTKNKRKDSDNVFFAIKFIQDGMVEAGVIENDGYKQIRNISNRRFIGESKVEVTLIEVC
jgi:Holliday junction resolvase RusA-like endonuclease